MAQKSMKGTQAFQDTIRTYLDNMAKSDALFAVKYANRTALDSRRRVRI